MTYSETIKNNCDKATVKWWTKHAFHYTDVENAVSVLSSGLLYSRIRAKEQSIMKNDNASIQVINMTESDATSYVRFYFRPLTPTQYYNEGFKHESIRYSKDVNANVPVPIFFAFDLENLLKNPKVKFSEFSQAGHGSQLYQGEDSFSNLDFSKIYSNGYSDEEERKFRHAEILYPSEYNIEENIKAILCRNFVEKTTLMTLLKKHDVRAYYKYKEKIKICKNDMFEKNALYVDEVSFGGDKISFSFADSQSKTYFERKQLEKIELEELSPVKAEFVFKWETSKAAVIAGRKIQKYINYQNPANIVFKNLPKYKNAKVLEVSLYIENKIMLCIPYNLAEIDLI